MQYDAREDQLSLKKLSDEDEIIYRIGLGVIRPNGDYFKEDKALYICGDLKDGYGFYRSLDEGKTWAKLNTEHQMFGDINSIEEIVVLLGDSLLPQVQGAFYMESLLVKKVKVIL